MSFRDVLTLVFGWGLVSGERRFSQTDRVGQKPRTGLLIQTWWTKKQTWRAKNLEEVGLKRPGGPKTSNRFA